MIKTKKMLAESFDFSGQSDTDYTDTFADIDQDTEMMSAFSAALRRDLQVVNTPVPDGFDTGSADLIRLEDDPDVGRILTWDADVVASRYRCSIVFCNLTLKDGDGGMRRFTET